MSKVDAWLSRGVEAVLALLMLGMVLMVFGNVVLRYAFNSGIVFSEEMSRFCFVWMTFIGAIVAVREGTHLGMDNLVQRLPRAGQLACLAASQVLILGCCAILFWGTWRQHEINASMRAPVTNLSLIWIFGLGYVCSVAIGLITLANLWRLVRGRIASTPPPVIPAPSPVIPAEAGIQGFRPAPFNALDSRLRGNDGR